MVATILLCAVNALANGPDSQKYFRAEGCNVDEELVTIHYRFAQLLLFDTEAAWLQRWLPRCFYDGMCMHIKSH